MCKIIMSNIDECFNFVISMISYKDSGLRIININLAYEKLIYEICYTNITNIIPNITVLILLFAFDTSYKSLSIT